MTSAHHRTGGQILVDSLAVNGVERIFCVPGESYLAALDALHDEPRIAVHVTRNEAGAAYMADAFGKLTGRPGICFVTRGPGATNASPGLHVAFQDSTPMMLLIGQVARGDQDREAFQEIDYRRMFSPVAKWVAQIDDAARIPEYVNRAFTTATSGRPGPVVLALPEDMLTDLVDADTLPAAPVVRNAPAAADVAAALAVLATAQRPMVIVGGSVWSDDARMALESFASTWDVPVATSFRCQDYFDNTDTRYAGDLGVAISPGLAQRVKDADVVLCIGARLGEMTTRSYTLLDIPNPKQKLIHVHSSAEELGSMYFPTVAVHASPAEFAHALATTHPASAPTWGAHRKAARTDYEQWTSPITVGGDIQMAQIVDWLASELPDDAIICNGAGNYTGWVHRFYRFRRFRTQLAPTNGAMGYGVPAAVGAKLQFPERTVVAFAGDGCFMMNGQEMATAHQYGVNVITIVVNNSIFGTIRMHQERNYPERISATDLVNPDFVALGAAYGAHAELVTSTEQFAPAFQRAQSSGRPALIEIRLDKDVIAHNTTLTALKRA